MEWAKGLLVLTIAVLVIVLVGYIVGALLVAEFFDTSDDHTASGIATTVLSPSS